MTTEPITLDNGTFEQHIVPGSERSAKQACQARNALRGGRIGSKIEQRPMDYGLWDDVQRNQGEMFT
jgi:hypothetical protein